MPCLCTFNTLRSFIRGVSHVDLPINSSTLLTSNKARRQLLQSRGTGQPFQPQYSTSASVSTASERWHQQSGQDKAGTSHDIDLQSVFAEISPENIDALAAESQSELVELPTTPPPERRGPESKSNPNSFNTYLKTRLSENSRSKSVGLQANIRHSIPSNVQGNILQHQPRTGNVTSKISDGDSLPRYRKYPDEIDKEHHDRQNSSDARSITESQPWQGTPREPWQAQKSALQEKFQEGWNPMKRLSPDALAGIRALHAQMPDVYTTAMLAENFKISPEAIRRILKSKWTPKEDEEIDRQKRWFKRGEKVWTRWSDEGMKAPAKWRAEGVGKGYYQKKKAAVKTKEQSGRALYPRSTRRNNSRPNNSRPTDDIPWSS